MHNYVDNFFGFRTFARRVEDCFFVEENRFWRPFSALFPSRSPKPAKSVLRIDSLVSWFFCVFPFETPLSRLRRQIPSQRGAMRNLMSRIRCLDVSTRIRLSNQKRHFSESQSKKCRFSSLRSVVSVGVALLEANRELHNVVIDLLFLLHSVTDSSAGMHYCGVIASAKFTANFR